MAAPKGHDRTHLAHRHGCPRVEAVPGPDRVRMKSAAGAFLAAIILVFAAASARAENWARVVSTPDDEERTFLNVDVDSIRKGDDGLVYYRAEEDMGVSPTAVDCQKRLYYVIGDGSWDWRSSPHTIKPGTDTATEADFVCSRA